MSIIYFFQACGIWLILCGVFTHVGGETYVSSNGQVHTIQSLSSIEIFIAVAIAIIYFAVRCYLEYLETAPLPPDRKADKWRTQFDNSPECKQYLALVKRLRPKQIMLTHTQPREEMPKRSFNRLYPQAELTSAPFFSRIMLKDDNENVIFVEKWPFGSGQSASEGMSYFYDWLSYHLPEDLVYTCSNHMYRELHISHSGSSYYVISETPNGHYTISNDDSSDDPPPEYYGYILTKKI